MLHDLFSWNLLFTAVHPARIVQRNKATPGRTGSTEERNASMTRMTAIALALSTGVVLSGSALADPAKFDGAWSVHLAADGGLCGSRTSQVVTVQNGSVRAGGSGVSVSGQVAPGGSVSLTLQKSGVQGSA